VIGKRDKAVHIHCRDDYIMRLKWIAKKFVVFYDLRDRRAWLVDGASALLHIVRASLRHEQNDLFKSLFLFDKDSVQEPAVPFTGKHAAVQFLTNKVNMSLPLYAKPTEAKVEETTTEAGARARILSSTRKNYSLKDRIESVYEMLEQIMSHQADVFSQDGVGFRIKHTLRRQVEGFDFMDVATDEDPLWPRVTTINSRGRGWVDFTRALHAVTLFGNGFGELLQPAPGLDTCFTCLTNVGVPKGEDYLAVCTSDLQDIMEKRGSTRTSLWRLVNDIYWYTPDQAFEKCQCKRPSPRIHERIQVILPASFPGFWGRGFRSPRALPQQGAVLFGHSGRFPLRWKDHGPPEEGEPQEEMEDIDNGLQDSGLGSSITSSSVTAGGSSQTHSDTEPDRQRGTPTHLSESRKPPKRLQVPQRASADGSATETGNMHGRPRKRLRRLAAANEKTAQLPHLAQSFGYREVAQAPSSCNRTQGSADIYWAGSSEGYPVLGTVQNQVSLPSFEEFCRNNLRSSWKDKGNES
jgi:hypothetical protein